MGPNNSLGSPALSMIGARANPESSRELSSRTIVDFGYMADACCHWRIEQVRSLTRLTPQMALIRSLEHALGCLCRNIIFGRHSLVARVAQGLVTVHDHAAFRTRALSKTNPALPYICRLTVFRRLMCPSTGPLLHRWVTAASTADSSRRMPSANRRISGDEDASPFTSQSLNVLDERFRIRSANSSAKPNAVANSSLLARIASIRLCSLGLRSSGRRTHSNDNCLGDGGGGADGLAAPAARASSPPSPAAS